MGIIWVLPPEEVEESEQLTGTFSSSRRSGVMKFYYRSDRKKTSKVELRSDRKGKTIKMGAELSEQEQREVISKFKSFRGEIEALYRKLAEVDGDRSEHE